MDQWLRNTNVVKVVALVIGILLWAVVRMDGSSIPGSTGTGTVEETIGNVAVTPKYNEDQFFIEDISPAQVTVTIAGRSSTLKRVLNSANYSVELDLTNTGKGEHMVPLTPVGFPSSVSVKITPAYAKVVVDEKKNKSMPVTVQVTGTPTVGLKAGQPVVKPKQVTVGVPSRIYEAVESVRADVDVDKADSPVTAQAKLVAYDKDGKAIEEAIINPAVVEVEVPITSPFKLVPLQVKLVGEPPPGFAVSGIRQSIDKVTVYGAQDMLDRLEFYEGPQVDLSGLKEDKEFTLPIPLRGDVKQIDPGEVTVSVSIVPSQTKILESIPLSIIGQNDGFHTSVLIPQSGRLNLTVEGAPDWIEKLKPQDVQGIVDVSNLPPGRHEVPVTWNLPTFVKKGSQEYLRATVEISAREGDTSAPSGTANPSSSP
ncbi:hypothetical protein EXW96_17080 [Paenibacillus sp. JMULE4]|uniref:CdaR family protein n=1 Tax=Paenibacillus sp. JMULE4 TaxID=2518342 RepID=UPI0015774563|nr:CdaR family protein [Paenibacillus sp. JMULE4]NTZ19220.1 hypothetical protein [Paenibacillus sp. JMULE4]